MGLALATMVVIITRSSTYGTPVSESAPIATGADSATGRQMNLLGLLIRRRGWVSAERDAEMVRVLGYHRRYSDLNKQEASKLITAWDDREK